MFTDGKKEFIRSLPCDRVYNNIIKPEEDQNRDFGIGYYTGSPTCWIPLMMRDGIINPTLNELCVVKFIPPEGIPIISNDVEECYEEFLVTDKPITITKKIDLAMGDDPELLKEIHESVLWIGFDSVDDYMNKYTYYK